MRAKAILLCCLLLICVTACDSDKEQLEKTASVTATTPNEELKTETNTAWCENGSEIVVQGRVNVSEMDFDTDSTDMVGVVPWYVKSERAKKMTIKKEVHLKWVESDLEKEMSNYDSNVSGCPLLTEIEVEEGNETLFSRDGMLFKYGKKKAKGLYACPVMKSGDISVPDNTIQIWSCAFNGCEEITSVFLPESIRGIGDAAFGNMKNCLKIDVSEDNPYYESEDGVLYTKGKKVLIAYPAGKKDEIFQVPDGVEVIASGAFMCTNSLKKVILPESVTQLCESSFRQCESLQSIRAEGTIRYLDRFAFYKTIAQRDKFPKFSKREASSWRNWREELDKDFVKEDSVWIHGYRGLGI